MSPILRAAALLAVVLPTHAFASPPANAANAAAIGRPVAAAEVQGTWVFDLEATLAHVEKTMHVPASAMRSALEANKGSTYVFSGSAIEVKGTKAGDSKGSFRIEGSDLVIKDRGEHRMQIGMSGKDLVLSYMGVGSIFKKQ
jgi:hypothetical protein